MTAVDLIGPAMAAVVAILAALIGGWFATRIRDLEGRVDELEGDLEDQWHRERQLVDFIYRNGLIPPAPTERNRT